MDIPALFAEEFPDFPPVLLRLLVARQFTSPRTVRDYLKPDWDSLPNPFLLPDCLSAVERLRQALTQGEKILVWGDRDVDGVTGVVLAVSLLRELGGLVEWYVPSKDGYGLNQAKLKEFQQKGFNLLLTVDCGISDQNEIAWLGEQGISVIVTDHHQPPLVLPSALAVVNPKRIDSVYPSKNIAGAGVVLHLLRALLFSYNPFFEQEWILVAPSAGSGEIFFLRMKNFLAKEELLLSGIDRIFPDEVRSFIGDKPLFFRNRDSDWEWFGHFWENSFGNQEGFDRRSAYLSEYFQGKRVSLRGYPGADSIRAEGLGLLESWRGLEERRDYRLHFFLEDNVEIIALAVLADMLPLDAENRFWVKKGLSRLSQTRKPGLRLLLEYLELISLDNSEGVFSAKNVSWRLIPFLNAAGRREQAELAVDLLLEKNPLRLKQIVELLVSLNQERRELQELNRSKVYHVLNDSFDPITDAIIIVFVENMEHGVTGVLANELLRRYARPVIILYSEEGMLRGSARAGEDFNLIENFQLCSDLLTDFGGHARAAGLSILPENFPLFVQRMKSLSARLFSAERAVPLLEIDTTLEPAEVNLSLLHLLKEMEPFGTNNPRPVFLVRNVQIERISLFGANQEHQRLTLSDSGVFLEAVYWLGARKGADLVQGMITDMVFSLERNVWDGKEKVRLIILDYRIK